MLAGPIEPGLLRGLFARGGGSSGRNVASRLRIAALAMTTSFRVRVFMTIPRGSWPNSKHRRAPGNESGASVETPSFSSRIGQIRAASERFRMGFATDPRGSFSGPFIRRAKNSERGRGRTGRWPPGPAWPASGSCRRRCGDGPSCSRRRARRARAGRRGRLAVGDRPNLGNFGERRRDGGEIDSGDRGRGDGGSAEGRADADDLPHALPREGDPALQQIGTIVGRGAEHADRPSPVPGPDLALGLVPRTFGGPNDTKM